MRGNHFSWPRVSALLIAAAMTCSASFVTINSAVAREAGASDTAAAKGNSATASQAAVSTQWTIPDSPASAALGVARSTATPPSQMRSVGFELINSDNANGFAGEISPYLLGRRLNRDPQNWVLSADDYQRSFLTRALARISVSAGLVDSTDKADRAALGVRWTLFNTGDPFNDRQFFNADGFDHDRTGASNLGCAGDVLARAQREPASETRPNPGDAPLPPHFQDDYNKCLKALRDRTWNATALQVSAVQQWRSEGGLGNLGPAGTQYAMVLSYGFEDAPILARHSQLLLALRRGDSVLVEDKSKTLQRRDETNVALRLRMAPDFNWERDDVADGVNFNFSVEANWSRNEYRILPTQEEWTYTVGAEWRVANDAWLGVTVQDRSSDAVTGDETTAGMQLRWALRDQAQFNAGPRR